MSALLIAVAVLVCVFAGALLGFRFNAVLPEHHLAAGSKGSVMATGRVLSTLTALVRGLSRPSVRPAR